MLFSYWNKKERLPQEQHFPVTLSHCYVALSNLEYVYEMLIQTGDDLC